MDALVAALPGQHKHFLKASQTAEGAGTWHSLWKAAGYPGAGSNPVTGSGDVPTKSTAGAFPFTNPGGANLGYLGRIAVAASTAGTLILYDRLWHSSGLVGNVITSQTVNSLALTRPDALGTDVELWGEIYTAIGATAATLTATYTDQDGNAGNSATYPHPANAESVGQMFPFLLAAGDTGVRSVQSVQWSVSTGTAGNFGLVLLRRVAEIPLVMVNVAQMQNAIAVGMPCIYAEACLALMVHCSATNTGQIQGALAIIEG